MSVAVTPELNSTVLVIDDDAGARERLCGVFENAGYRGLSANGASSALRLLQNENCDLIVLELALPGSQGLALCRLIRAQPATSKLPIIALSRDDSENNVESRETEALAAGADDYIANPSSLGEIVSRATAHLRAAQRERALIGSNRELAFLADLGRGLLRALEPDQLVRRVAGATYEGANAVLCAAFVKVSELSDAVCIFDREGSAEDSSLLEMSRLTSWL